MVAPHYLEAKRYREAGPAGETVNTKVSATRVGCRPSHVYVLTFRRPCEACASSDQGALADRQTEQESRKPDDTYNEHPG
jgi:hypothetical protein